jgi:isoamylase
LDSVVFVSGDAAQKNAVVGEKFHCGTCALRGRRRPVEIPLLYSLWEKGIVTVSIGVAFQSGGKAKSLLRAQVKGFTKLHPAIPEEIRGTFEGLGHAKIVEYIRSLGVTSIELLPIHWFPDDAHLLDKGLKNHWGYNSLAFFAPASRYYGPKGMDGFRDMVRAFHDGGIEVILEVVYNHPAEGNELGPTLSFKGIDNFFYYRTMPDQPRYYINDTGTGNTVNTSHPRVLQMVTDSLRYWAQKMHVDGFPFDLGILGREPEGFDQRGGFFDAVGQDPVLSKLKLVGEPWDIGPGGYQVGGFPPGWAEWADKYRDTVRHYWKDTDGTTGEFAARVLGSGDVYDLRCRRPWAGVNFITAHDGFTLNDVVSYDEKHNDAPRPTSWDLAASCCCRPMHDRCACESRRSKATSAFHIRPMPRCSRLVVTGSGACLSKLL